jgi:hypothetical protein
MMYPSVYPADLNLEFIISTASRVQSLQFAADEIGRDLIPADLHDAVLLPLNLNFSPDTVRSD